ncbi:MAG TPA: hypothetical protein C5S50_06055 [Methanosarcinaceae archaeon]|nr:hypothetical protein [Methanosarcinaceae archaeon]
MNEVTFIFVEGKTEVRLLKQMNCPGNIIVNCKGALNIPGEIERLLEPFLNDNHSIKISIMRDRDNKETHESIIQSFGSSFDKLLGVSMPHSQFQPHREFKNLYTMNSSNENFHVVLHIAAPPPIESIKKFASDTIYGYIFALAMTEKVLQRFAKEAKITPDVLRVKVLDEVPELAKQNGIEFNQAKDYLGVYMAMSKFFTVKRDEKIDGFSGIIVARAKKYETDSFRDVFRSIHAALQFIDIEVDL